MAWLDAPPHSGGWDLQQPEGRALRTKQQLWEGERATAPAEAGHVLSLHRRRVKKSDFMRRQDIQLTPHGEHGLLSKKEQNRVTLLQEGGPLPGPEAGFLSNTRK